jgi:hypothetical protein
MGGYLYHLHMRNKNGSQLFTCQQKKETKCPGADLNKMKRRLKFHCWAACIKIPLQRLPRRCERVINSISTTIPSFRSQMRRCPTFPVLELMSNSLHHDLTNS